MLYKPNVKLEVIYRQIPKSECPLNCGLCCGILWPSEDELRNIKSWLESHGKPNVNFHMIENLDCPCLTKEKRCSIYPVRPFLCRILGAAQPIPCPIHKNKPAKILTHSQSGRLYRDIYLTGEQRHKTEKHGFVS